MKTVWPWLRTKLVWIGTGLLTLISLIAVISIKLTHPYRPAFYLFAGYLDEQTKRDIDGRYSVKEYGDVNEFDFAIANQKATAGITSDYLIVNLINEGKIAPISQEMRRLNGGLSPTTYLDFFTDEAQQQMQAFDQFITPTTQLRLQRQYPDYGPNYQFKFSDFVVPYFMNDQVYAFDTSKILGQTFAPGAVPNPLGFAQVDAAGMPWAQSMVEAVATIVAKTTHNRPKIQWIKNEIENTILGSEYDGKPFSTTLTNENYQLWLDNFERMVTTATGHRMSDNSVNLFETDSDAILNNLIDPNARINIATLYNGDALDAYWGDDNFDGLESGDRLRFVRSQNSIRILDGFIVSSDISSANRLEVLQFFNYWLFDNVFKTKAELETLYETTTQANANFYELPGMLRIFDFVNYTVSAKGIYELLLEDYFIIEDEQGDPVLDAADQPVVDQIALNLFKLSPQAQPISPVDKELVSKLTTLFQQKING